MGRLPSFIIIGAMKSATSTLYDQLSRQAGIFMPELKEPNFFSDDAQYDRGLEWYSGLFDAAERSDMLGEASTHYTKLPTYPQTVARIRSCLAQPRLIYVMRDPIDRLISQYIHQWSEGEIHCRLEEAIGKYQELIAYSCYARQLKPFFESFGKQSVLPIFFDRLTRDPQGELERVCSFIGYRGKVRWNEGASRGNVSAERVRKFPLYDVLVDHPIAVKLRRSFVPKAARTKIRQLLSMRRRPTLGGATREYLEKVFDEDLATLSDWLDCKVRCDNFRALTAANPLNWR
jgi:hypothetical protein